MIRPAEIARISIHEQPLNLIMVREERDDPQSITTAVEVGEASIPFFLGRGLDPVVYSMRRAEALVAANEASHFTKVAAQLCATLGLTLHADAHCASLATALRDAHRRPVDLLRVVILPVKAINYEILAAFVDLPPTSSFAA